MSQKQTIVGAINARHTDLRKAVERCAKTQDDHVMARVEQELRFTIARVNGIAFTYEQEQDKGETPG